LDDENSKRQTTRGRALKVNTFPRQRETGGGEEINNSVLITSPRSRSQILYIKK